MSEPAEQPPAISDSRGEVNERARLDLHDARTEAVTVLAVDVALFVGLATIDKAKGWGIIDFPWWAWLLLGSPALLLMILLLVVPLAELSPGRVRNFGVALLGLLAAAEAVAVVVLLAALVGSSTASLSAGELLTHGAVVWLTNIITFGLLFWQLDEGGPRVRARARTVRPRLPISAGRRWPNRLEPTAGRLPLRVTHQRDRGQPDGHDAADAAGQGSDGRGVAHLLHRGDSRHLPRREHPGHLAPDIRPRVSESRPHHDHRSRLRSGERGRFATGTRNGNEVPVLRPQCGARGIVPAIYDDRRQHRASFQQ